MELVLQDLVGFGKSYHSLNVYSLGGDDPIPHDSLGRQLIDSSHGGWGVHLDIMGSKEILYLK